MKSLYSFHLLFGALLLLLMACSSSSKTASSAVLQPNTLSAKERKEGWTTLFDGKSLQGWRTYQRKQTDAWTVSDGTLHCNPEAGQNKTRADLMTIDEYENFELAVDWKIAPKGNSGIIYLASEKGAEPYLTGPEYQLIDDKGYPAKLESWQNTGANYAMDSPTSLPANPAGEWNHTVIKVNKAHVEHWLNGVKVVEYELWTDKWKAEKAIGKWKDAPDYGSNKKGHITLQNHGDEAWFRNVKLRRL